MKSQSIPWEKVDCVGIDPQAVYDAQEESFSTWKVECEIPFQCKQCGMVDTHTIKTYNPELNWFIVEKYCVCRHCKERTEIDRRNKISNSRIITQELRAFRLWLIAREFATKPRTGFEGSGLGKPELLPVSKFTNDMARFSDAFVMSEDGENILVVPLKGGVRSCWPVEECLIYSFTDQEKQPQ